MTVEYAPATTVQQQAPLLLGHIAGYVGHRTIALGLRQGMIAALAAADTWVTPDELAERLRLDPFYVAVWCRAALAAGLCDVDADTSHVVLQGPYRLAPHVATLLLDTTHPAYLGGVYSVLEQPEVFDRFEASLPNGERLWWDSCSPSWVAGVAGTGLPFYTRLAPGGLDQIPGLAPRLESGARIVDTACGSGAGLVHLARTYPACHVVGVDGDPTSIDQARGRVADVGLSDRVSVIHTPLEELTLDAPAACVINNISMHECRDIDRVTANIRAVLEPGGWFVISDFPFPDTAAGLRSIPGQVMCGIQFFEAQIDDQLLPRSSYDDLLARHGFAGIAHLQVTPMHAVTFGRAND